jgi:putative ABC transport system substrate-binding protein
MKRRDFLTLATAIAWPRLARAQEPRRVIGFLSAMEWAVPGTKAAFLHGLKDTGFVEGQNVDIEYRAAEGKYDRLPRLAAELVSRNVLLIVCYDAPSAFAAKEATRTIPIVFLTGADPVKLHLIESLSRPGGNLTGVWVLISFLAPKRLELLRELLPNSRRIILLANANNPNIQIDAPETKAAADALGLGLEVLTASTESDLESIFATMAQQGYDALMVMPDPFFIGRRQQLIDLAARYALPAIYPIREYVEVGGLMSYGSSVAELYQLIGTHTGKILAGARPADLPVQQTTNFELAINLKTAQVLGLTVSPALLARADEVIE